MILQGTKIWRPPNWSLIWNDPPINALDPRVQGTLPGKKLLFLEEIPRWIKLFWAIALRFKTGTIAYFIRSRVSILGPPLPKSPDFLLYIRQGSGRRGLFVHRIIKDVFPESVRGINLAQGYFTYRLDSRTFGSLDNVPTFIR